MPRGAGAVRQLAGGLFGTFLPFDERSAERLLRPRRRRVALLGQPAVRRGARGRLVGAVGRRQDVAAARRADPGAGAARLAVVTLGSYRDLERELVRATSVVGITPPVPGQDPADYLGGVAREAKGGLVLILDHLEEALGPRQAVAAPDVVALAARVVEEGGRAAARAVDRRGGVRAPRRDRQALGGPSEARHAGGDDAGAARRGDGRRHPRTQRRAVGDAVREAASRSRSRPISAGAGPAAPSTCRLVARAIVDLRLASLRRYRRSGGPAVLPALWLADVCRECGRHARPPRAARRQRAARRRHANPTWACRRARARPRGRGAGGAAGARAAGGAHARAARRCSRSRTRRCARRCRTSRSPDRARAGWRAARADAPDRDRRAPARCRSSTPFTATCAAR